MHKLCLSVYVAVISIIYTLWEDQASTSIRTWRRGVGGLNDNTGVTLEHSSDLQSDGRIETMKDNFKDKEALCDSLICNLFLQG